MPYLGVTPAAEFTSKDLNGEQLILDADADKTITADTDDQIDIRIAGADDFQFTANSFTAQSGSTIAAQALTATTITPSGSILASDGAEGTPSITFASDTDTGFWRPGANEIRWSIGSNAMGHISSSQVGFGTITNNANQSRGITVDQATLDDEILALKSGDVAHGHTSATETDTYWSVKKRSAAYGGVSQYVMSEDAGNGSGTLNFDVRGGQADNSPGTGDNGLCNIIVGEIDGTSTGFNSFAANDTLFTVRKWESGGSGRTIFAIDEDGDIHVDGSTSITAFDEYDDAALIRAHEIDRTASSIIRTEFDKWVSYNKESLEDAGILNVMTPEKIERGDISLLNTTQLQRLHSGAIVQQRAMFETMKSVAEEMIPGFAKKLNERLEAQSLPALPA